MAQGGGEAYLGRMSFWRRISPRRAVDDFAEEWRRPTPHRWQVLGVAVAMTFALMVLFIPENQRVEPARPEVTYITSWRGDRTDEEIVASNIANQRRKEREQALAEQRAELRKELYRQLGEATGLDVDAMERQIAREQAAEQAAKSAAAQDQPDGE